MKIKNASFVTTVASAKNILTTEYNEIAFVGRSNVGKSSLINALTNRKGLAKTSSTPGKTKHINYFNINDQFYLVDLPGYGYHKASKSEEKQWTALIESYLMHSDQLKCVFVLLDIRHKPSVLDKQMLNYLNYYKIPYVVIATKADKLSRAQQGNYAQKIANEVGLTRKDVIITSASGKSGIENLLVKIEQFVGQPEEND